MRRDLPEFTPRLLIGLLATAAMVVAVVVGLAFLVIAFGFAVMTGQGSHFQPLETFIGIAAVSILIAGPFYITSPVPRLYYSRSLTLAFFSLRLLVMAIGIGWIAAVRFDLFGTIGRSDTAVRTAVMLYIGAFCVIGLFTRCLPRLSSRPTAPPPSPPS